HLSPGPPLSAFPHVVEGGLVARRLVPTPFDVRERLGVPPGHRAVLVSFGGFGLADADHRLPPIPGVTWILAAPMSDPGRRPPPPPPPRGPPSPPPSPPAPPPPPTPAPPSPAMPPPPAPACSTPTAATSPSTPTSPTGSTIMRPRRTCLRRTSGPLAARRR